MLLHQVHRDVNIRGWARCDWLTAGEARLTEHVPEEKSLDLLLRNEHGIISDDHSEMQNI